MANKDSSTAQQDGLPRMSGKYHHCCDLDNYHYVKKTGYLIKSPSAGRIGRWRKRWFRLVDRVLADSMGGPIREVMLEYFIENPQKLTAKVAPKMKGINMTGRHACIMYGEGAFIAWRVLLLYGG